MLATFPSCRYDPRINGNAKVREAARFEEAYTDAQGREWELKSLALHEGGGTGGHWVAYVKRTVIEGADADWCAATRTARSSDAAGCGQRRCASVLWQEAAPICGRYKISDTQVRKLHSFVDVYDRAKNDVRVLFYERPQVEINQDLIDQEQ